MCGYLVFDQHMGNTLMSIVLYVAVQLAKQAGRRFKQASGRAGEQASRQARRSCPHLRHVMVLDPRRGVELHVFSQAVRLLSPFLVTSARGHGGRSDEASQFHTFQAAGQRLLDHTIWETVLLRGNHPPATKNMPHQQLAGGTATQISPIMACGSSNTYGVFR